jgi:hypothetical protein
MKQNLSSIVLGYRGEPGVFTTFQCQWIEKKNIF